MKPAEERGRVVPWPRARTAAEREFLPAALEIVETPASPAGRTIAATIMLFFAAALTWSSLGSVDIIATAQGRIVPTGRTKVIQPFETGVVRAIPVRDGLAVKAGQVLIELDSTINEAERDRLEKDLLVAKLDAARLRAALSTAPDPAKDFVAPPGAAPAQVELQGTLLANQLDEIRAKLDGLDRQIAQNEGNRSAVESTIAKLNATIPLLQQQADLRKYMADKEYGSKITELQAKQDLLEHQHELQVQKGRLAEAMGAIAALKEQRRQSEAEYRRTNLADLAEAEQKASGLEDQLRQATEKYRLQTLTAPVDGTVQQLAVHTVGGVVTPAQALMVVVPAESRLEIEAMVPNRDIGFVHEGQEAQIKVDTFNFTKYGLLHGTVESVSQDAITRDRPQDKASDTQTGADSSSSEPKGQELVYAARVSLDRTQMEVDGRMVNLSPGMAVTVEIKTGARRVISYLLSPLLRYKQESLRER